MTLEQSAEGLRFSFTDMGTEIESLRNAAQRFLDPVSHGQVLHAWKSGLTGYQHSKQVANWRWQINEANPVRTISSKQYLRGGNVAYEVIGILSAVWEIKKVAGTGKRATQGAKLFSLNGLASTRLSILRSDTQQELARWRFEIGDASSPGCHFHVQVMGGEDDILFPKQLRVPRLPGVLVTPMDAMEFLLGELFQDDWEQTVSTQNKHIFEWAGHQRKRLIKILGWQREELEKSRGQGTPWNWLKNHRPNPELLVQD